MHKDRRHTRGRLAAVLVIAFVGFVARTALAQGLRLVPETGHTDWVHAVSYSPDGTRIVTGSEDNTAKVWDASTGKELLTLRGHVAALSSASFSPDGTRIVTGALDNTARVWDARTGKQLLSVAGIGGPHDGEVNSVAFSPDGTRVVMAYASKQAQVWDAITGKVLLVLTGHAARTESASFSPDGTRIVTASDDNSAKVWDAASGKELVTLLGHQNTVWTAHFSPDGARIVTASQDGTVEVWSATTGKVLLSLKDPRGTLCDASFSPDGARIVTGSFGDRCSVWDASTGKELLKLIARKRDVTFASYSPDGTRIVTSSLNDRVATVWDAMAGQELLSLTGHASPVLTGAFTPSGARLITESADIVTVRDGSGKVMVKLDGGDAGISSVSFSPDGRRIVTGDVDKTAKVWSVSSGKELLNLRGHTEWVKSAVYSRDGARIVTAAEDGTAKVWDAVTGKELTSFSGQPSSFDDAAVSSDGTRIVTWSEDATTATVWNATTGKALCNLQGYGIGFSASFSPDGKRIVAGTLEDAAGVWNAVSGKRLLTLSGHSGFVTCASFSPDGTRVLTASYDNTAKVWDSTTGNELFSLNGHASGIVSASLSPAGTRIVTASSDGSFRFWDARSGMELYALTTFMDDSWIAVSADGRYDSSDGAQPHYGHFVMDLPSETPEVVDFSQINTESYWEPNLVRKITNGTYKPGEQPLFTQKPMPKVEKLLEGDKVKFRVTERFDGGVGEVRIIVGGGVPQIYPKGGIVSGVWTTWDSKGLIQPGEAVDVIADSASSALSSPRGQPLNVDVGASHDSIRFVGLAMGVKEYTGTVAPLKYAGDDAIAVARAMLALAKSLGPSVKPELYLLTDEAIPDDLKGQVTVKSPSKGSFDSVVTELKGGAKFTPNTVLFLDFSGHGAMVDGKYVYLTKDSHSADPVELRNELAGVVSMDDIVGLLNLDLGGKRLLVLDTCQAAGIEKALAANLKAGEADLDAQRKLIANMQNKYAVGTQVLSGCPEGQASFEDPRYGHGLLTYSLLYCLRNNDLGDKPGDPEVWADRLVADTASQTQRFAEALGLKQDVQPLGAHHFPIGDMSKEDRLTMIKLPAPKPAIGTCVLVDDATDFPADAFNQAFITRLETTSKGSAVVHIASSQAPGVWNVSGHYRKRANGQITLTLHLSQGEHRGSPAPIETTVANAVEDAYKAISDWLATNAKP